MEPGRIVELATLNGYFCCRQSHNNGPTCVGNLMLWDGNLTEKYKAGKSQPI